MRFLQRGSILVIAVVVACAGVLTLRRGFDGLLAFSIISGTCTLVFWGKKEWRYIQVKREVRRRELRNQGLRDLQRAGMNHVLDLACRLGILYHNPEYIGVRKGQKGKLISEARGDWRKYETGDDYLVAEMFPDELEGQFDPELFGDFLCSVLYGVRNQVDPLLVLLRQVAYFLQPVVAKLDQSGREVRLVDAAFVDLFSRGVRHGKHGAEIWPLLEKAIQTNLSDYEVNLQKEKANFEDQQAGVVVRRCAEATRVS